MASKSKADPEFALTIAAVPVTICILFLAGHFTRRESLAGMLAVITLFFAGLAYFLFKLVRMYQHTERALLYLPARRSLTTFAVLTIILIVLTIANAIVCTLNFGRGLKPYVMRRKVDAEDEHSKIVAPMDIQAPQYNHPGYLGPAGSRMTID